MSLINFDTQEAFLIPDDKREEYFEWVENLHASGIRAIEIEEAWNCYNDNIIIANREFFTQHNWGVIQRFMNKIGAKNITETLI